MPLVKLKDKSIIEIEDTLSHYTTFAGTFNDDIEDEIYGLKFILDNGTRISLNPHQDSYYNSPLGFVNPSALIINILNLVSEKENENMTIEDFIIWCSQYSSGFKMEIFTPGEGTKSYPRWCKKIWSHDITIEEFIKQENIKFN